MLDNINELNKIYTMSYKKSQIQILKLNNPYFNLKNFKNKLTFNNKLPQQYKLAK